MRSRILWAETYHARSAEKKHRFSYKLPLLCLDLSELAGLEFGRLLTYNRLGLFSIYDRDYLMPSPESLERKANSLVGGATAPLYARALLLTSPRYFNYVFNPVSFYLFFDQNNRLSQLVAEVSNTFGERHVYRLENRDAQDLPLCFTFKKEFFVSPFFEISGQYQILLKRFDSELSLSIRLIEDESEKFYADLKGRFSEMTSLNLIRTWARFPLSLLLSMSRIHFQALILWGLKWIEPKEIKLRQSPNTLRSTQGLIHNFRLAALAQLARLQKFIGKARNFQQRIKHN